MTFPDVAQDLSRYIVWGRCAGIPTPALRKVAKDGAPILLVMPVRSYDVITLRSKSDIKMGASLIETVKNASNVSAVIGWPKSSGLA